MYPGPESATEYSGQGLVVFPASGTATFSVEVPHDYRYEIILRIQVYYRTGSLWLKASYFFLCSIDEFHCPLCTIYNTLFYDTLVILKLVIVHLIYIHVGCYFITVYCTLQPSSAVEGVHIFIESQSPVQRDLHCVSVTSAITSTFSLPFSLTPTDHLVADSLCMMAGVTYTVRVEHLNVFDSPWMLDSVRYTDTYQIH